MSNRLNIKTNINAADFLVSEHGAFRLPHKPVVFTDQAAIVGIIHEEGEQFAFYCHSATEMIRIAGSSTDERKRTWVVMETKACRDLCGL